MKVDVIGSNSLLFANLPPASQVPGRTYRVSDVGPAPGILLTSDGTRYRPAGGRQVLAMRTTNPVTVQALSPGAVAETIGPFPGGLVRAGMQLELQSTFSHPGVGSAYRGHYVSIGSGQNFVLVDTASAKQTKVHGLLMVQGDGSVAHSALKQGSVGNSYQTGMDPLTPIIDFSASFSVSLGFYSAAETAVNISSATWAGGIATFNTSAPHTLAVGDKTVIAGVTPTGWNIPDGAIVLSVPTTTRFTVAMAADPGTYTSGGTSSRISNMISRSYVLELVG